MNGTDTTGTPDAEAGGVIAPFGERYRRALADPRLRANLLTFQRAWRGSRDGAFGRLAVDGAALGAGEASFESARARLIGAKDAVLADPPAAVEQFVAAATAAGTVVHRAATAAAAREIILALLRQHGARLLAKGKSMVAEEIGLNHYLEAAGLRVVETDLGEWIIQLAHETPSHMVMPAIHKSRQQVASLFALETGQAVPQDDDGAQGALARETLRREFLAADAGMIGANALIAESGSVMLVTNEGNGDLVSTLPPLLIVIAGWEKIVPTFADAAAQLRLLARSATGQEITTYTTFITGPEPGRELHLVLVDNGRTAMWQAPDFRDALRCIRCAACADVCPPYQVVGGHVFGHIYSGAIGLVNTPFHHGIEAGSGPQSLCVSCNACATVCPVGIPLPRQILDVRARTVAARGLPWLKRAAFFVWSKPRLFDLATRAAAVALRPLVRGPRPSRAAGRSGAAPDRGWGGLRGPFLRLPLPAAWRWRTPPSLAPRPARDSLAGRTFPPASSGPWAGSRARGATVAYFLQCLTDRFAPAQAEAAIRVVQACGVCVVVPPAQHCCGLPAADAGDLPTARRMARQTIEVLEQSLAPGGTASEHPPADYIVTAAASCAIAVLHDYAHLFQDDPAWAARAARLAARTLDVVTFLDRVAGVTALQPLPAPPHGGPLVTYHGFCQSTNVLRLGATGARLLEHAGYTVAELPEADVCCGFGGGTSIDHPLVAQRIVERKLANVTATGATILATDNPGCLLHLRGAADAAGLPLTVRHVVELLSDRLTPSPQGRGG
jgi:L-lactate dehydrogenase complex protein LldF